MRIRSATSEGAEAMAGLLAELGYPTSASALPARLRAIAAEGGTVFLAVDSDDTAVGLASVALIDHGGHGRPRKAAE